MNNFKKIKSITIFALYFLTFNFLSEFAYSDNNYEVEITEIEKDRIIVAEKPFKAFFIANKWFNQGQLDLALEFDKLYIKKNLINAERVANRWFDRGYIEFALEFDRLVVQRETSLVKWSDRNKRDPALEFDRISKPSADSIADKWFDRGYIELALEFDRIAIQEVPINAEIIGDKWFDRDNKEFALEFYRLSAQEAPDTDIRIGNKWLDHHNIELALEFYRTAVQKNPTLSSYLSDKCLEQNYVENAYEFAIIAAQNLPDQSISIINKWIKKGQFTAAQEFANRLLSIWISQNDDSICNGFLYKLLLAVKIKSAFFYETLKNKYDYSKILSQQDEIENALIDKKALDDIYDYTKALQTIALKNDNQYSSIPDFLLTKISVHPELFNQDELIKEQLLKTVEKILYDLYKKNDIIASLLHSIALHAKENPYFRANVFDTAPRNNWENTKSGAYNPLLDGIEIVRNPLVSDSKFSGTLIHEWCHQLMDLLYNNQSLPYRKGDQEARRDYLDALEAIADAIIKDKGNISELHPEFLSVVWQLESIVSNYDSSEYESEFIVRLPQIIAENFYDNSEVKQLLMPLYDYWMKHIAPDIDKYIQDHSKNDDFISY